MKTTLKIVLLAFIAMLFISCEKEQLEVQEQSKGEYYDEYIALKNSIPQGKADNVMCHFVKDGRTYEVFYYTNIDGDLQFTLIHYGLNSSPFSDSETLGYNYSGYLAARNYCGAHAYSKGDINENYTGKLDRFVLCQNSGQWIYYENGQHYESTWYFYQNSEGEIVMSEPVIKSVSQAYAEDQCGLSSGTAKVDRCTTSGVNAGWTHEVVSNDDGWFYNIYNENGVLKDQVSITWVEYQLYCGWWAISSGKFAKDDKLQPLQNEINYREYIKANLLNNGSVSTTSKAVTCLKPHSGPCSSECDGIVKVGCTCCPAEFYNNQNCPNGHYWQDCPHDELG